MSLMGGRRPGQMPVQRAEDARRPGGEAGQGGARSGRDQPGNAGARGSSSHHSRHRLAWPAAASTTATTSVTGANTRWPRHDRQGEHREHLAAPGKAGRNQLATAPRHRPVPGSSPSVMTLCCQLITIRVDTDRLASSTERTHIMRRGPGRASRGDAVGAAEANGVWPRGMAAGMAAGRGAGV